MSATLTASDRKRLASILGMLGSNASGERDNAARLAEAFRREHGLTWAELLTPEPVVVAKPQAAPEPPPAPPAPAPPPPQPERKPTWQASQMATPQPAPKRRVPTFMDAEPEPASPGERRFWGVFARGGMVLLAPFLNFFLGWVAMQTVTSPGWEHGNRGVVSWQHRS